MEDLAVWITLAGTTLLALALLYPLRFRATTSGLPIPIVPLRGGSLTKLIMNGRSKYPRSPFIVPWSPPWIILPHSSFEEIKNLPEDKMSFKQHAFDHFLGKYTGLGQSDRPEIIQAVRLDLTRSISKVLIDLQEETSFAINAEIGECREWKKFNVYTTSLQLVARTSARTFVGLPLARDPDWLDASITFTMDTLRCVAAFRKYPAFLWPFVSPWLPELRKLKSYRTFAARKLRPQIEEILKIHKENLKILKRKEDSDADHEALQNNYNLIHWTIGHFKNIKDASADQLGHLQMTAAFAAISPIGIPLTQALFDLAAHPEWQQILREEFQAVLAEEEVEAETGQYRLSRKSIPKLRNLDSFLKESQRMSPPSLTVINRKVTASKGLKLSTGHILPANSIFGLGNPYHPLSSSPQNTLYHQSNQAPMSDFDPWRYRKLRDIGSESQKHQYTTVDSDNIVWGYGKNLCPGRFFAGNTLKCILVEILTRYDLGLGPQGQGKGKSYPQPNMIERGWSYVPDPEGIMWIRDRVVRSG